MDSDNVAAIYSFNNIRLGSVTRKQHQQHSVHVVDHAKEARWASMFTMLDEQPNLVNQTSKAGRWPAIRQAIFHEQVALQRNERNATSNETKKTQREKKVTSTWADNFVF